MTLSRRLADKPLESLTDALGSFATADVLSK
jgi:hypothetical protein